MKYKNLEISGAVVYNDKIICEKGNSKTVYELASLSKSITALAVILLYIRNALDLDMPVINYLHTYGSAHLTCRKLLQHIGGLEKKTIKYQEEGETSIKKIACKILLNNDKVQAENNFDYATGGYVILGAVIEAVSGITYEEFVTKYIFEPLQMHHTSVENIPLEGYKRFFFSYRKLDWEGCTAFAPAGYIISNSDDMQKWLKAQLHPELLSEELCTAISISHDISLYVSTKDAEILYGFGWYFDKKTKMYYHEGCNPCFTAYQCFLQEQNMLCFWISNYNDGHLSFQAHESAKKIASQKQVESWPKPPIQYPFSNHIDNLLAVILPIIWLIIIFLKGKVLITFLISLTGVILCSVIVSAIVGGLNWKQINLWLPNWQLSLLSFIPAIVFAVISKILFCMF